MPHVPAVVMLHVWRVPTVAIPRAAAQLGLDRPRLHRARGLTFAKGLGTGGASFAARDATPTRWALLTTWESAAAARAFTASPVIRSWGRLATESARLDLRPLSSRGRWSRREPFGNPAPTSSDGPVVVVTRARLRVRKAPMFWRAIPPVSAVLHDAPGLRLAFGMGEAPLGVQGTVSVWDSEQAVRAFAYGSPEHTEVIRRTPVEEWYAEELFARFALVDAVGSIDGEELAA